MLWALKFIYVVGTKIKMDFGRYIFDQTVKHAKRLMLMMRVRKMRKHLGAVLRLQNDFFGISEPVLCELCPEYLCTPKCVLDNFVHLCVPILVSNL